MRPTVSRITEADPTLRRIHVKGEVHPGELAERGYVRRGEEWILEVRRPGGDGRPAIMAGRLAMRGPDSAVSAGRNGRNAGRAHAGSGQWMSNAGSVASPQIRAWRPLRQALDESEFNSGPGGGQGGQESGEVRCRCAEAREE